MGLFCSKDQVNYKEFICDKCNDTFTLKKRDRTSCRYHRYDENGECVNCNVNILSKLVKNCYHEEKRIQWWLC